MAEFTQSFFVHAFKVISCALLSFFLGLHWQKNKRLSSSSSAPHVWWFEFVVLNCLCPKDFFRLDQLCLETFVTDQQFWVVTCYSFLWRRRSYLYEDCRLSPEAGRRSVWPHTSRSHRREENDGGFSVQLCRYLHIRAVTHTYLSLILSKCKKRENICGNRSWKKHNNPDLSVEIATCVARKMTLSLIVSLHVCVCVFLTFSFFPGARVQSSLSQMASSSCQLFHLLLYTQKMPQVDLV